VQYVIDPPPLPSLPVQGGGRFPVRRIYCVGRNYADHAVEMGQTGREPPFFFMKPADALLPVAEGVGEMDDPGLTDDLQHEIELVVALGRDAVGIRADAAAACIWGYAVGLDMTRRDLQGRMKAQGRPWEIAKAFEQSAPVGPLVPKSRCGVLQRGAITLSVNGTERQHGDLAAMIWSVDETIAQLSAAWHLRAGDLIFTGTPAGVGRVVRGDRIDGAIAGLPPLAVVVR
jgi:fumarylpyruvate hydrolase